MTNGYHNTAVFAETRKSKDIGDANAKREEIGFCDTQPLVGVRELRHVLAFEYPASRKGNMGTDPQHRPRIIFIILE